MDKWRRWIAVLIAAALCFSLASCAGKASDADDESSEEEDLEYPVVVGDLTLRARPGDVVSLSPALTEKLLEMGFGDRVAGVSSFCDVLDMASGLPQCGTATLPDLEAILDLSPDLVLVTGNIPEGSRTALLQADIEVAVLPPATDLDGLMDVYMDIARLLEGNDTGGQMGEAYVQRFRSRLDSLSRAVEEYTDANGRKSMLYVRVLDFNVATGDTLENQLFDLIGLDNVAAEYTGWLVPESEWGSIAPDVIFSDQSVTMKMFEGNPHYKGLNAVLKDIWLPVDGAVFERQSQSTIDLLMEMAQYAYEDADLSSVEDNFSGQYVFGGLDEPDEDDDSPGSEDEDDELLPLPSSIN